MSELRRARSRGSLGMGPRPASEGPPFEAISGSQARMHGDAVRSEQNQNGNRNETEINGTAKDRGSTRATATEAVKTNARKAMTPSPVAFCAAGQPWCLEARDARWWGTHSAPLGSLGRSPARASCNEAHLRLGELSSPREGSPWVILGSREVR